MAFWPMVIAGSKATLHPTQLAQGLAGTAHPNTVLSVCHHSFQTEPEGRKATGQGSLGIGVREGLSVWPSRTGLGKG